MKLGIVTSEGGMSCAYSVGVLRALVGIYGITDPYVVVGGSGSSNTLAFYLARQYQSILNIWTNLLSTRKFISFWRFWKILNIDYMIDEIFKKQDPLDAEKILQSKTKLFIATTDEKSGEVAYFKNDGTVDVLEALRASSASLGLYRKSVKINGQRYVDSVPAASFSKIIEKAKAEGADKIIAIYNSNDDLLSRTFLRICGLFQNKNMRRSVFEYCNAGVPEAAKDILIIKPSEKIPVKTLDNKRDHIIKTIELGYRDGKNAPIKAFLNNS